MTNDKAPTDTTKRPSDRVLIGAARILLESENDEHFPIAEIMLRNILNQRATADVAQRLTKIGKRR